MVYISSLPESISADFKKSAVLSNQCPVRLETNCAYEYGKTVGSYCEKKLADGTIVAGEFKQGLLHGMGSRHYANNVYEQGEYFKDQFIKGNVLYPDGGEDIGTFKNGDLHGDNCTRIYPKKQKVLNGVFQNNELVFGNVTYANGRIDRGAFFNGNLHGDNCVRIYPNNTRVFEGVFNNNEFMYGKAISPNISIEIGSFDKLGQFSGACSMTYFANTLAGTQFNGTCEFSKLASGTVYHHLSDTLLHILPFKNFTNLNYTNLDFNTECKDLFEENQTPFFYNESYFLLYKKFMQNFDNLAASFYSSFLNDILLHYKLGEEIIEKQFDVNFLDNNLRDFTQARSLIFSQFHKLDEPSQDIVLGFLAKKAIDELGNTRQLKDKSIARLHDLFTKDMTVFTGLRTFSRYEGLFYQDLKQALIFASFFRYVNHNLNQNLNFIDLSVQGFDSSFMVHITNVEQYNNEFQRYYNTENVVSPQLFIPLDFNDFLGYGFRIPKDHIVNFIQKKPTQTFQEFNIDFKKNIFFRISKDISAQDYRNLARWSRCAQDAFSNIEHKYKSLGKIDTRSGYYFLGGLLFMFLVGACLFNSKCR